MKFPIIFITVCLIYQVYAGSPSYQTSSDVDVRPKIILPSGATCDLGNKYLCELREKNSQFSTWGSLLNNFKPFTKPIESFLENLKKKYFLA